MKNKLLIIGASGHGKVLADIALKMKRWKIIAFLDDDVSNNSTFGLKILGTTDDLPLYISDYEIIVGIGDNKIRKKIQNTLETLQARIPILIHPNAVIGKHVDIGVGTVVMAGAIINCNTKIGKGCIINTGATVDHDNYIEDYVHISPGVHLAGHVKVGKNSWLGIGSIVSNNINITKSCKIGAGACVVKDITKPGVYVGVPAKRVD